MPKKKITHQPTVAAPVKSYKHRAKRPHIPTQEESVNLSPREKRPVKKKYAYDPSIDPQLVWAGKEEQGVELSISTVPIYVQEHIAPEAIIARLKAGASDNQQQMLFGETAEIQATKAIDFYTHEENWKNRMILGDSLLVMNSLLEKEGMRGKIQTVYIDPPYGIKFGSNWQTSTRKRDVKDNKLDDFVRQPEQIKAFRDTWELGIHSYLSYLRDRLTTARELLTESGSCFVQINDENVHLIRNIMDEVFGSENFVSQIGFQKTGGVNGDLLPTSVDYIVWYSKNKASIKYRQLYLPREKGQLSLDRYDRLELENGTTRAMTHEESDSGEVPFGAKRYRHVPLYSDGQSSEDSEFDLQGKIYQLRPGTHFKTNIKGLQSLTKVNRLEWAGKVICYKRYADDFYAIPVTDQWKSVQIGKERTYVVQTADLVIRRCVLMTTDPGDIVLDPTCGSGTTAYVAEQWGRRWITIDTSRVALALARTRLMTAKFPYYKLKENGDDSKANVAAGFICKTIPHVTLKSLANDEDPEQEVLYDQPLENKDIVRVSGPFTVESLAPHRVSDAQEMVASDRFVEIVVDNLRRAGVQTGKKGARVEFENLEILPSGPEIQAVGEYKTTEGLKKVVQARDPGDWVDAADRARDIAEGIRSLVAPVGRVGQLPRSDGVQHDHTGTRHSELS